MLIVCALPIFFVELALGQYHGAGPNIVFKNMAPILTGVGYSMIAVTFYVNIYYNEILAWAIYYTYKSFSLQLAWKNCGNEWNTKECFSTDQNELCKLENATWWNNRCYQVSDYCQNENLTYGNLSYCFNQINQEFIKVEKVSRRISPSEDFFLHKLLNVGTGFNDFGHLQGHLVLCLFLAWFIVAGCLLKGVKSSGKVVYFTALFPYVVLVILLIRGVTLDGAVDGIIFYIVPKWEKLIESGVWIDAATQIFYSLGPAFGALLTLSSYNRFNNNCMRDAVTVAICNCGTSVFAGFVIFSIVGFMAHTLEVPVSEVVRSGQGLAFVAYPEAVAEMPLSQLWSVLFFIMLITLGLDSQFSMCETMISAIQDEWPALRHHKTFVAIGTCLVCFILGLPLCCRGGAYLFTLIDSYAASWSLLIICFCEFILVSWIYGYEKFSDDVMHMLGFRLNLYWKIHIQFVSPLVILIVLAFTLVGSSPAKFGNYIFIGLPNTIGWIIGCSSVAMIPIFALIAIYKTIINQKDFSSLFHPTDAWGPSLDSNLNSNIAAMKTGTIPDVNIGKDNSAFNSEVIMTQSEH